MRVDRGPGTRKAGSFNLHHRQNGASAGREAQLFPVGEQLLVACEETRSRAHGQHTEVFPGANATSARPRPAPGWRENGFFGGTRLHGNSPAVSIARSEPRTPL